MNEDLERQMSELADGELDRDQANSLLAEIMDDAEAREQLKAMLRLRQAWAGWRTRQPPDTVRIKPEQLLPPVDTTETRQAIGRLASDESSAHEAGYQRSTTTHPISFKTIGPTCRPTRLAHTGQLVGLATAAMIGGLLVMGGFWLARPDRTATATNGRYDLPVNISAEAVRQAAGAFALHESVGGPLKWYAADEQRIQFAAIDDKTPAGKPVTIFLEVKPAGRPDTAPRSYVIICREGEQAALDFPPAGAGQPAVRVHLIPAVHNGRIEMRYAISLSDGASGEPGWASLAGERLVGTEPTELGLIALGGQRFNVGAAARLLSEAVKG